MTRHFKTIPVAEKEALTYFIYMVKTNKSKLDRDRRDGIDADWKHIKRENPNNTILRTTIKINS